MTFTRHPLPSRSRSFGLTAGLLVALATHALWANERCVLVEVYVSDSAPQSAAALAAAQEIAKTRRGVQLAVRSVDDSDKAKERLTKIAAHFRIANRAPLIYACNRVIQTGTDAGDFQRQLTDALTMEVYTRRGCKRCERAQEYLPTLSRQYPAIRIVYREILGDANNQQSLNNLVRKHGTAATSTPVFHLCDDLIVGFDRPETTGARLQQKLLLWTMACPSSAETKASPARGVEASAGREVIALAPF